MNIEHFWKAVLEQNRDIIRQYFSDDAYVNWHCTNEHFTVEEFIRANCEYPGEWDGEIERIENAGDVVITGMMVKHHNGVRKCTLADQSNKSCLFGR